MYDNRVMSNDIIFKKQHEDEFWKLWNEVTSVVKVGPRYIRSNIEFQLAISVDRCYLDADRSFVYVRNGKPVAAVLLPVESIQGLKQVSLVGAYAYAPIFIEVAFQKEIFQIIEKICIEYEITKIMFSVDPFLQEHYNYLQKFGFLDTSILVYFIDLETSRDLLHSCRRGHKCDIKKISNDKRVEIFHFDYVTAETRAHHDKYIELHHKCSGEITRPVYTFEKQYEQLMHREAVLIGLAYNGKPIAYSYFTVADWKAIYTSGADDPNFNHLPLYHSMLFNAMEYLKQRGVHYIDTSQPSSPSTQMGYYPDAKQLNIAHFKRGFGGDYRPQYRGVKYFSPAVFEQDAKRFSEAYSRSLGADVRANAH